MFSCKRLLRTFAYIVLKKPSFFGTIFSKFKKIIQKRNIKILKINLYDFNGIFILLQNTLVLKNSKKPEPSRQCGCNRKSFTFNDWIKAT